MCDFFFLFKLDFFFFLKCIMGFFSEEMGERRKLDQWRKMRRRRKRNKIHHERERERERERGVFKKEKREIIKLGCFF